MIKSIFIFLFLLNTTIHANTDDNDAFKRILLGTAIISTWTTIGINEGQKWKQNSTGNIDLFWKDDYHLYRSFTSAGLISIPVIALSIDGKYSKATLKTIAISNLMGWAIYECMVTGVQNRDDLTKNKDNFSILGTKLFLPAPLTSLIGSTMLSGVIYYSF